MQYVLVERATGKVVQEGDIVFCDDMGITKAIYFGEPRNSMLVDDGLVIKGRVLSVIHNQYMFISSKKYQIVEVPTVGSD